LTNTSATSSNLGLIDQHSKKNLYELNVRDGSSIAVIPFIGLNILTMNER